MMTPPEIKTASARMTRSGKRPVTPDMQENATCKKQKVISIDDDDDKVTDEPDESGDYEPASGELNPEKKVKAGTGSKKGPKTNAMLREELKDFRKEKKECQDKIVDLEKEVAKWKGKYSASQLRIRKLEADKLEAFQRSQGQLLDDTKVRKDLDRIFNMSYQWAVRWQLEDPTAPIASSQQILETIRITLEDRKSGRGFLSEKACHILPFIPNGRRLLIEGILNHAIVEEILMCPMGGIFRLLFRDTRIDCKSAMEQIHGAVHNHSPDEARLLHAHCIRATNTCVDHDLEKPTDASSVDQIRCEEIAIRWLNDYFNQLLRVGLDVSNDDTQTARKELRDICVIASKLSRKLWTQNEHILSWGNCEEHLRCFFRPDDLSVEPHRFMKMASDGRLFDDKPFDMFTRPAMQVFPIGELHAEPKIWLKAVGVIFSEHVCKHAISCGAVLPSEEVSDDSSSAGESTINVEENIVHSASENLLDHADDNIQSTRPDHQAVSTSADKSAIPATSALEKAVTQAAISVGTSGLAEPAVMSKDDASGQSTEHEELSKMIVLKDDVEPSSVEAEPGTHSVNAGAVQSLALVSHTNITQEVGQPMASEDIILPSQPATFNNSDSSAEKQKTEKDAPTEKKSTRESFEFQLQVTRDRRASDAEPLPARGPKVRRFSEVDRTREVDLWPSGMRSLRPGAVQKGSHHGNDSHTSSSTE